MNSIVHYGERKCEALYKSNGKECNNQAYFSAEAPISKRKCYVCNLHKKGLAKVRGLPHMSTAAKAAKKRNEKLLHLTTCDDAAKDNKQSGRRGNVMVSKLLMMKSAPCVPKYLTILPNYKDLNREDGWGIPELSPKSMGPIRTGMARLPIALNLENYHQFAKVFPSEFDKERNEPTEAYWTGRAAGYADAEPHRHKPAALLTPKGGNKNVPMFSVYIDKKGNHRRFSYIECRWFYCVWYEHFARLSPKFQELKQKLDDGYNLNIVGYDGRSVEGHTDYQLYVDGNQPFGHELVLWCLLKQRPGEILPWHRYRQTYPDTYKNIMTPAECLAVK